MTTYVEQSARTESKDFTIPLTALNKEENIRLLHGAMGAVTESSELLDSLKKSFFYGKPIDVTNLKEEVGDVFFYLAIICRVLGTTFEELQELNNKKLLARFPVDFTTDKAINRNLEVERIVLEGGS